MWELDMKLKKSLMWATMVIDNIEQFDCLCKSKIAKEEQKI